jgi:hypothetical protein
MMTNNDAVIKDFEQRMKGVLKTLPKLAGNELVNFAKDNFKRQGFLGESLQLWRPRKQKTKWGITPRNNGRAILVDTAKLKRANRIARADWQAIIFNNSMPYARAHNEGLRIGLIQQVKAHTRKRKAVSVNVKAHKRRVMMNLPKRQFIGDSPYLRRNIHRVISLQLNKAFK